MAYDQIDRLQNNDYDFRIKCMMKLTNFSPAIITQNLCVQR